MSNKKQKNKSELLQVTDGNNSNIKAMSKKSVPPTISASVWDQWLNRLGVVAQYNGVELIKQLDLLSTLLKYQSDPVKQLSTICTELLSSVNVKRFVAYKHNGEELKILFSSFTRAEIRIAKSSDVLSRIKRKPTITVERLKESDSLKYLTIVPFLNDITIALFNEAAPERQDLKFLHIFTKLTKLIEGNHKLSKNLLNETERFATITHHLSEGLMILDGELNITIWNRPLQRLTGFTPKETYGKSYSNCFKSQNSNWLKDIINQPEGSNVFYRDLEIKTKDNKPKWVSFSGSILRNGENKITQVIILVRDISKNKELEDRKNEFISIATHELRTPITAVKGYLSLLNKDLLTETQSRYLKNAEQATDRLVKLAEDLLQVIHVEENRLNFALKPLDICEVVTGSIAQLKQKAQRKGLTISYLEPKEQFIIAADKLRLTQVITNLLDNAIKYSNKGEITISARYREPDRVDILISDQGIGMSSKDIANAFAKFHRGENGRRTSETGAGLGLFIVKNFVEKQGGTIKLSSKINHGTTFQLSFPIIKRIIMVKKSKENNA